MQFLFRVINYSLRHIIKILPKKYELPINYFKYRVMGLNEPELLILPNLISKGGTAIDIGANIGFYSYVVSRICDKVEAFEPIPYCCSILQAYNAPNINVHGVALSSKSGTAVLNIPIVNNMEIYGRASVSNDFPSQKTIQVSLKKLDDYNFTNVNFIKIDVEGHELDVIRGAKDTITKYQPVILVEIEQRHLSFPMNLVFEEILAYGYKGFFLYQSKFHPISEFSSEFHQALLTTEENMKDNRNYINNFIFSTESLPYV